MPFTRTNWMNYSPPAINAANLLNMEDGIWYGLAHSGGVRNTAEFLDRNPASTTGGLAEAIADLAGGAGVIFAAPHNHPIGVNYTVPANVHLMVGRGATFTVANGVTLTINGPPQIGLFQVFNCIGTGTVSFGAGSITEVYPEWFGAVPDGVTDCTAAITKMLASISLGDRAYFSRGTWYKGNNVTPDDVEIYGAGIATIFKKVPGNGAVWTLGDDCSIHDFCIDGNKANDPNLNVEGVRCSDRCKVYNFWIHDTYKEGVRIYGVDYCQVYDGEIWDCGINPGGAGTADGIYIGEAAHNTVERVNTHDNARMGIVVASYAPPDTIYNQIINCEAFDNGYNDIFIGGDELLYCFDTTVELCRMGSITAGFSTRTNIIDNPQIELLWTEDTVDIVVRGNRLLVGGDPYKLYVVGTGITVEQNIVEHSVQPGAGESIYIVNSAGVGRVCDNIVINGFRAILASGISQFYGNNYRNLGNVANAFRATTLEGHSVIQTTNVETLEIHGVLGATRGVFWRGGIPTTGTFVKGDICFNNDPDVAEGAIWQCTAGGTPGTWVEVARVGQEAWQAPGLAGTWVNFGAPFEVAGYFKDSLGIVHLKGRVKDGVIGTVIFTLPAGYRPAALQHFAVPSNNLFGICSVAANGQVATDVGNNTWFSLDGITFRVA